MTVPERFPYVEAKDYTNINSIKEAFPHLKNINQTFDWSSKANLMGLVIRSANDDNVHKVFNFLYRLSSMEYGRLLLRTEQN